MNEWKSNGTCLKKSHVLVNLVHHHIVISSRRSDTRSRVRHCLFDRKPVKLEATRSHAYAWSPATSLLQQWRKQREENVLRLAGHLFFDQEAHHRRHHHHISMVVTNVRKNLKHKMKVVVTLWFWLWWALSIFISFIRKKTPATKKTNL